MACKFYNLEKQHYARMQEADYEKVKEIVAPRSVTAKTACLPARLSIRT
jgi:hypothetical protein